MEKNEQLPLHLLLSAGMVLAEKMVIGVGDGDANCDGDGDHYDKNDRRNSGGTL